MVADRHTFTSVCVYRRDRVFVSAVSDALIDEGNEDHALIFRWQNQQWTHWPIANGVGGIAFVESPTPKIMCMGIDGEISLLKAMPLDTESVDRSEDGPSDLLHLKCIRPIGQHVYVAGMGRHVYRRVGANNWQAIDQGVFAPRAQRDRAVGFNAIDGTADSAIYAVGYQGEIWFYDGKTWAQQDSPTNVALTCVRCLPDGNVYVGGMAGTLMRGRAGQWESILHDTTDEDFWGMAIFNSRIYVANYHGVFVLEGDVLTSVELRLPRDGVELSTAYLDANDGVLWSVGQKDLAYSEDGVRWVEVSRPN